MNEMIKSIYEAVADIVTPFKTLYPYQDIEADVDNGVVTFAPVKIENLTLASERLLNPSVDLVKSGFSGKPLNPYASDSTSCALAGEQLYGDNSLLVDSVSQVGLEVDIYKTISWNDKDISAFDMAERLQIFLKSSQARDKFYNNYKYELMPVWSDIRFQADFNTYKKWVQIAQFEISITKMSNIILEDKPLKNVVVSVTEVNTLENNKAYGNFADRFLKTN